MVTIVYISHNGPDGRRPTESTGPFDDYEKAKDFLVKTGWSGSDKFYRNRPPLDPPLAFVVPLKNPTGETQAPAMAGETPFALLASREHP